MLQKYVILKVDSKLIIALLEKWRTKTHMFHLPIDKYTIILEDMSMLLGFRINGKVVNGPTQVSNNIYILRI